MTVPWMQPHTRVCVGGREGEREGEREIFFSTVLFSICWVGMNIFTVHLHLEDDLIVLMVVINGQCFFPITSFGIEAVDNTTSGMAVVAVGANMCLSVSSRATKTGQMALSTPLSFPFASTLRVRARLPSTCSLADSRPSIASECSLLYGNTLRQSHVVRAVEESQESTESDVQNSDNLKEAESIDQQSSESTAELTELGAEIKKALEQRKEKAEDNLLSGVAEEIGEIEWPAFGKVLGTTGVVLGVIAGSSVALLTVNALLAELSDKVFAGKGIQDFFG